MEDLASRSHERILARTGCVDVTQLPGEGGRETPGRDNGHCIVTIGGLSSAAVNATWRAALIARDLGATLLILHPAAPPRVLTRAETSLRELTDDIKQRTRVEVVVEAVRGNVLRRAIEASHDAAMVVLPSTRGNPLREWIMGSPAEQLIRLCRSPVLVVKRPALVGYRRVLVAVHLEGQAVPLIEVGSLLSRGSAAEVLHVMDVVDEEVLCGIGNSQEALRGFRQHRAQGAYVAIHRLISASQPAGAGVEAVIEFGPAPAVVLARTRQSGAELMVIGKRQRGLLADYFLGGMTQRMLAQAPADVLVHPAHGLRGLHAAQEDGWRPAAGLRTGS